MIRVNNLRILPVCIFLLTFTGLLGSKAFAGSEIGAQIYCVMREGGNEHETSWQAAYEAIKHNKGGLFKTSPKHAAVMIVETIVRESKKYESCIGYVGDIYKNQTIKEEVTNTTEELEEGQEDRYSY